MKSTRSLKGWIRSVVLAFSFLFLFASLAGAIDYTYDDLNRLLRVEYDDGTVIEYVYDEVGNRVQRVTGAALPDMAGEPLSLAAFVPEGPVRRADVLSVWAAGVKGTAGWNI
jgi:YD repeat-containing protein